MQRVDHDDYDFECPCGHILSERLERQLEECGMSDWPPPQGRATKIVREDAVDSVRRVVDRAMDDGEDKDTVMLRLRVLRRNPPKVCVMLPKTLERLGPYIERKF
jgi:hypothetical protein